MPSSFPENDDPHSPRRGSHSWPPICWQEVHSYVNYLTADLGYVFNGAYSTLLEQNAKISRDVSNVEHPTFLMYFFSKYFYGTSSIVVIQELQPFICMLLSNRTHSWGAFFLTTLHRGMHNLLHWVHQQGCDKKIQWPAWILQLWTQLYFKDFSSTDFLVDSLLSNARVLPPQLIATPIEPLERLEVLRMLYNLQPKIVDWCPILERGIDLCCIFCPLESNLVEEDCQYMISNWAECSLLGTLYCWD